MSDRRALVVTTPAAAGPEQIGASLRVDDVRAVLQEAGFTVTTTTCGGLVSQGGAWDIGVAVSYACISALRPLRRVARRTWLDACDSWLLVDGSGLRAGHLSYALRGVRDAARLLSAPAADLVTYISAADLRSDRGTIRGRQRLVLPGRLPEALRATPGGGRRLVLAGDWDYPPNSDGLRWLTREVLPHLKHPVHVFGRGSVPRHPLLLQQGYVLDPATLLHEGDVHLAPVRFGGGVKYKVLQPLMAGLPVVTTPAGAHGLRDHPLLDVTSRPRAFSEAVIARQRAGPMLCPPVHQQVTDCDDRQQLAEWLTAVPVAGSPRLRRPSRAERPARAAEDATRKNLRRH